MTSTALPGSRITAGAAATAFGDLRPGRYFGVCFIPEGTTPTAEGQGPPHFTMGMLKEFAIS